MSTLSSTEVFETPSMLTAWSDRHRVAGHTVALVPTMGALHDGHMAMVSEARRRTDVVVVSIFVNPLQFDRGDDFDAYPRPIEDDLAICAAHGVDVVYAPRATAMYPAGFETHVLPGALGDVLQGAQRPGHFRGVTTVVAKLFGAARPHVAVFGEKDFQQLTIIRRMTADLDMGIEIVGIPTVREPDGLAMSSRNRRLSPAQRGAAACVSRSLHVMAAAVARGTRETAELVALGRAVVEGESLARLEHLEVIHDDTLQPLAMIDEHAIAVTAVWFGEVRLIDNRLLVPRHPA